MMRKAPQEATPRGLFLRPARRKDVQNHHGNSAAGYAGNGHFDAFHRMDASTIQEETKRRQGWRKNKADLPQKSAERDRQNETRERLSQMAGVSRDTLAKVKKLLESAPSDTLEQLRSGSLKVNKAYISVFKPEEQRKHEEAVRRSKEMDKEIACAYTTNRLVVNYLHIPIRA